MEGFGFSAHKALVLPAPRLSLFLIFSFFYFHLFKPGLSRTLRRLGGKKSETLKFSGFFRKGAEGKAVLLVSWQDVGQQGASCLWCTGSCVCSFGSCRDTHTHTLSLEISYSFTWTGGRSLYGVRTLMRALRCTLV